MPLEAQAKALHCTSHMLPFLTCLFALALAVVSLYSVAPGDVEEENCRVWFFANAHGRLLTVDDVHSSGATDVVTFAKDVAVPATVTSANLKVPHCPYHYYSGYYY